MANAQIRRMPLVDAAETLVGHLSIGDISSPAEPDRCGQPQSLPQI